MLVGLADRLLSSQDLEDLEAEMESEKTVLEEAGVNTIRVPGEYMLNIPGYSFFSKSSVLGLEMCFDQ